MAIPSIFINYRREDSESFAARLKERIEATFDDVKVFLDIENIEPGADWPDTLEKELQKASIVLSLVGEKWLFCHDGYGKRKLDNEKDWVRKEIELALSSGKILVVILVDIKDKSKRPSEGAFEGLHKLKGMLRKQHVEIRSRNFSSDFQPLKDFLAKFLNQTPLDPISSAKRENILRDYPLSKAVLREIPIRPLAPGSDPKWKYCPFVGLNYFTRDAARLYFGRERDLLELILMIQNQQHRLIFLHGYSGVGKSSLLSAGLIPRLEERWLSLYHRRDKAVGLGQGLRNLRKEALRETRPTLYILDQVEEIFTDLSVEDEQTNFVWELAEAIEQEPEATFLLGFRSEYFPKIATLCLDNISRFQEKEILPLSREGVIQAITGVWKDEELNDRYRLDIEEGLPEKIADHLSQHQIRDYVAPILQNRLERLWEKAFKGPGQEVKLTKDLYDELGDASEKELLISRLERIRQQTNWDEEKTLRVLDKFVIDLPSAGAIKDGELDKTFANVIDYGEVLKELQKVDLLIKEEKGLDGGIIRLSHDLLAKSIRAQYDEFQNQQALKLKRENFDLLFKEAGEALLEQQYDEAANNLEKAIKTGVKKEQLAPLASELIYFYNEVGKPARALDLIRLSKEEELLKNAPLAQLKAIEPADKGQFRKQLRGFLQEQDNVFFSGLEKRYYPEMIFVEGGEFGVKREYFETEPNENGTDGNEVNDDGAPSSMQFKVSNFYIASTPVTFRQYCLFCEATNRPFPDDNKFGKDSRPVINVNWYDAIEYCNWLSKMKGLSQVYEIDKERIDVKNLNSSDEIKWRIVIESGKLGFRLPTEAEWEFAARGRGQRPGNQFAGSEDPFEVGWYKENSESQTHPVKGKKPNELGLYDMSGNVWEWCWDWDKLDYYKGEKEPIKDPDGPDSGSGRVLRGGSWDTKFENGYCAYRLLSRLPSYKDLEIGFRLARPNSS